MIITPGLVRQLAYPRMPQADVVTWAAKLGAAMAAAEVNTPRRAAHLLAQATHESMGFYSMFEIWGPTSVQRRYEGREDLGNTQRGDGYRYRGRGPFQLTGRANYRSVGDRIGFDLEGTPDLAAQIGVGSLVACDYWTSHGLNARADQGGLTMVPVISRVVNGGLNGLEDRLRRYRICAAALGTS